MQLARPALARRSIWACLREVVGAHALGAVAGSDEVAALRGERGRARRALRLEQPRAQHLERLGLVLVLRALVLPAGSGDYRVGRRHMEQGAARL